MHVITVNTYSSEIFSLSATTKSPLWDYLSITMSSLTLSSSLKVIIVLFLSHNNLIREINFEFIQLSPRIRQARNRKWIRNVTVIRCFNVSKEIWSVRECTVDHVWSKTMILFLQIFKINLTGSAPFARFIIRYKDEIDDLIF